MVPHVMLLWLCVPERLALPGACGSAASTRLSAPVERPRMAYAGREFHGHLGPWWSLGEVRNGRTPGDRGQRVLRRGGRLRRPLCQAAASLSPRRSASHHRGNDGKTNAYLGSGRPDRGANRIPRRGRRGVSPTAALTAMLSSFRARPKTATQGGNGRKLDKACLESQKDRVFAEGDIFVVEKAQ